MGSLLTERAEFQLGSGAVADTTSETTSAVEDMRGFDEIVYVVKFGDVDASAVLTFTAKENTASSTSSPTPTSVTLTGISGTGATISSGAATITESGGNLDNKTAIITVKGSAMTKRYQFLSITVSAESYEIVAIDTIKIAASDLAVTQPSEVVLTAYAAGS